MENDSMKQPKAVIFDLDGTLYQFPDGGSFMQIPFGQTIQQNVKTFIANEFSLNPEQAAERYEELMTEYDGEMSLGLEREFGIDRSRFFAETWNLNPAEFIVHASDIRERLRAIAQPVLLLSAAPRVWVDRALQYMNIDDIFGDNIISGDPDLRKPNPDVFRQAAERLNVPACDVISVGDQEHTDIVPAQSIGMSTLRIGSSETVADIWAQDITSAIEKITKGDNDE